MKKDEKKEEIEEVRFDLLDHWLIWYGVFNATEIGKVLGISRQNVSLLIKNYLKARPEGTVHYNASRKMYEAGEGFVPKKHMSKSHLFLDHLRGQELITMYRPQKWWDPENEILFENLDRYGSPEPKQQIVSTIVKALREEKILNIRYQSRRKDSSRLVSPNRLVYAVDRYHLRAFCHQTTTYRDFVLTRIFDATFFDQEKSSSEGVRLEWVSESKDSAWNNQKILRFRPNKKLNPDVIETLKRDFPVIKGVLTIECNEATAPYIEMKFARLDFKYRIPQWVKLG